MTLRVRMMVGMLSAVAISGGVSAVIGTYMLRDNLHREAENRVKQDLNAAQEFYDQRLQEIESALFYTALSERFSMAVMQRDRRYMDVRLDPVMEHANLDLLWVLDPEGRVLYRAHDPEKTGDVIAPCALVERVASGATSCSGSIVFDADKLAFESQALLDRARISVLATPKARQDGRNLLEAGLMMSAAAAVRDSENNLAGILMAAVLLNRNFDLVDQVQNTVFRDETYRGRPVGTSTLFLDDVRISTNVQMEDGSRAVGSRASIEVYDHVVKRGKVWVGSAWVVNDWYLSAYDAILDDRGLPVGMLYVGERESKFTDLAVYSVSLYLLVILGGLIAAGVVAWTLANSISKPARELSFAALQVARGDFTRTLPVRTEDEIGALTRAYNKMALSLAERDEDIKERIRLQLARSERLASVGRLAAGVAHEINNPLTGILTFAHLLRKGFAEGSTEHGDADTIIEASTRCKEIVRGLLDFSRRTEPQKRMSDLNEVLRQAVHLTSNQARINGVEVVMDLAADLPDVYMDLGQIQQVAVNLMLNAVDAMSDSGTMTVTTRLWDLPDARRVEFEIADTGTGIPASIQDKVFDPFFTTKPQGKGTGLGLAIAHGIIEEHKGQIKLASEEKKGTTLRVLLPLQPEVLIGKETPNPRD